jgi:hypothetical protein
MADRYVLDCGADQLFLAARIRCELGSRIIFSGAACSARKRIFARVSGGDAAGGLFSYAPVFGLGDATAETAQRGLKP